jgi:transcription elongation GreA/GreB family factor
MSISRQQELIIESSDVRKESYAVLCELGANCILSKADRRALAQHIQRADKIGTGAFQMLTRLLSQKLLYATVLDDDNVDPAIAVGGSRITYAIDNLKPQTGQLFHNDEYACGQNGIHVGTLLGATLIGMKVGAVGPFLQADGTFRSVRLLCVGH